MKLTYLFALFILVSCGDSETPNTEAVSVPSAPGPEDKLVTVEAGKYKVEFPDSVYHTEEYHPLEVGDFTAHNYVYSPVPELIYAFKYVPYPFPDSTTNDRTFAQQILQNALSTSKQVYQLDSVGESVRKEINGKEALYYQGENGQFFVTLQYMIDGNELYQLVLSSENKFIEEEEIARFFTSFQLSN